MADYQGNQTGLNIDQEIQRVKDRILSGNGIDETDTNDNLASAASIFNLFLKKWEYPYVAGEKLQGVMTRVGSWTMISNKKTSDRPEPQPVGDPFYIYDGISGIIDNINGKQVVYGTRVSKVDSHWAEGYEINVVAGNNYDVLLIRDPLGDKEPVFLNKFTAKETGWKKFGLEPRPVAANTIYDLIVIETQTDTSPITTLSNYTYRKPKSEEIPISGQLNHSNKTLNQLWISYIDDDAVDRTTLIQGLVPGGLISISGQIWAVQDYTDQGTYAIVDVAPQLQANTEGLTQVVFETPADTTLSYFTENNYWLGNPDASGLFIEDGSWEDVANNDNFYGVNILVQEAEVSPDWDLVAYTGSIGSASSTNLDLVANTVSSENGDVVLDFVGEGDDKGAHLKGGQFSNGTWYSPQESIFGAGDSTTETMIVLQTDDDITYNDITNIAASDTGSTFPMFNGTTTGKSIYVGADFQYLGNKIKINTDGLIEPDNVLFEYWTGTQWQDLKYMSCGANYPQKRHGRYLAQNNEGSEQWRVDFDPYGLNDEWQQSTINGDLKYWARVRIISPITTDPILEQIKLHTNRTEINDTGLIEFFGLARYETKLLSSVNNLVNNAAESPRNYTVNYAPGVSAGYKDNLLQGNSDDSTLFVFDAEEKVDTSIKLKFNVSFEVTDASAGDAVFEVYTIPVEDGFIYDGTASAILKTREVVTVTGVQYERQTVTMYIDISDLEERKAYMVQIKRPAASDAADTLTGDTALTHMVASGYCWKL